MKDFYDVVVVGYGPAGVTAAIYAARKRLAVGLFGDLPGGEVRTSGEIENWPGDRTTDGNVLSDKLVAHLKDHADFVDVASQKVVSVTKQDASFITTLSNDSVIKSKTVVYAAGRHPRELGVPGEKEFKNKGVSYCATCDGPLFPDKDVVVVGGGNTGAEAVIMLQNIARKVYLLHNTDTLIADPILIQAFDKSKVEVLTETNTTKVEGSVLVESLSYTTKTSEEEKKLDVQGVFVTIGAIPNTDPVKDLVDLNEFGAVIADRYGKTSEAGFFAAGDVTDIRDAQIVVAAGHGCSAALSAGDYIDRQSVA